ncbi:Hint domain-containing protein [Acetobacter oryzifermentans]|uniref:Hint domain-containing protein n=1 Tax=Acetobacter oryzifermentans TaxID=1633874 RepID=UPI0034639E2F
MATTINKSGIWDYSTDHVDSIILDGTSSPITLQINTGTTSWGEGDNAGSAFTASAITVEGNVTLAGNGYLVDHGDLTNNGSLTITNPNFSVNGTLSGKAVTIKDGGALTVGTVTAPVSFGSSPSNPDLYNTLKITNNNQVLKVENLSPRDKVIFDDGNTSTLHLSDDGTQILDQSGTVKANVTLAKGYDASDYHFDGNTLTVTCFLTGSMIRTSKGDVAVEDIQIGDKLVAFDWKNNKDIVRPVVWVGKARAVVQPELHDDEAGWPVRILKDAIADGVPYKDMLITAEHCLFFRDRFVPVRMLVNGVSIFYDKSITSYDYYHVETEQHSVITADGMLTESYLDTGNRASFRQACKIATLRGAVKSWEDDAGAPLGVEQSFVEPLFRALEWRENSVMGCQIPDHNAELTNDPDLHLVTDKGGVVRPMRKTAQHYSFMLPPDTQSVRIVSRASRPADVIGPFVDDRRSMGVAVADVHLQCAKRQFDITAHLQEGKPAGWYDTDWTDCAWTNGDAELPLGDHLIHGKMGILSMTIRAAGPYLLDTKKNSDMKLQSA